MERLRELARRRGARFVPVWMSASVEALTARVSSPGRAERSKLVDPEVLRRLLERPELPAPTDALSVDMSETTPAQAAERILASLGTGTSAIAQP